MIRLKSDLNGPKTLRTEKVAGLLKIRENTPEKKERASLVYASREAEPVTTDASR
ncbi:hypothetical protein [Micavibrio aeruginosavorus]|uniref:hypothetical protein n=1 Tax=Micavibrio aeruginosavorus TaxID=349221 RepID=UPI001650F505|nr:hypothetical protein [Micavibrio aeruginosavorus]